MKEIQDAFNMAELLAKKLEGKLSREEKAILDAWRHKDDGNLVLYHKLARNPENQYFEREAKLEKARKEEVWNRVQKKVRRQRFGRIGREMLKYAASVAIVSLGLFYLAEQVYREEQPDELTILPGKSQALLVMSHGEKVALDQEVQLVEQGIDINNSTQELVYRKNSQGRHARKIAYNTIIVPKGGEYKLTLVDGTRISLNSNTKLKYPTVFSEDVRKVFLEGEAFFQVARDTAHPFVVAVDDFHVEVLGTSFNVNAYDREDEIITTLVEGKVKVEDEGWHQQALLAPDDQFRLNKRNGSYSQEKVDTRIYTAWKDGRFVFENESLEEIMLRLSRWYDVEVFFLNDHCRSLRFVGDLPRYESIHQILEMIEVTQKVKFTIKDKSIMVEDRN